MLKVCAHLNMSKLGVPVKVINPSSLEPFCEKGEEEQHQASVEVVVSPSGTSTSVNITMDSTGMNKAPPVCVDVLLREKAMTAEELQALAFEMYPSSTLDVRSTKDTKGMLTNDQTGSNGAHHLRSYFNDSSSHHQNHHYHSEAVPVSSSSSTCTRESDAGTLSDIEKSPALAKASITSSIARSNAIDFNNNTVKSSNSRCFDRENFNLLNAKVAARTISRTGRSSQRWLTCTETNETTRLVAGCVPILQNGKVLLASSSSKPDWILPKGGWEQDESLEESAIRECFEEAGVLGFLGPRLSNIDYEPRKVKKRRLELEELEKMKKNKPESVTTTPTEDKAKNDDVEMKNADEAALLPPPPAVTLSEEMIARIRGNALQNQQCDDTLSTASTTLSSSTRYYSQVRMILFPLYVTQVESNWPESGRFRTAMDIDEAIATLEKRPEFKAALLQVKERGLHLAPPLSAPSTRQGQNYQQ